MITKLLTTTLLFFFLFTFSQQKDSISIYNKIEVVSSKKELTIHEVVSNFKNNNFRKEKINHIYKKLGNKNWWFNIPVKKSNEDYYLTLSSSYISYGKLYLNNSDSITALHQISYFKEFPYKFFFYRHPTWVIPANSFKNTEAVLNIKNGGSRTRLEFHLETKNQFLKRTQLEYIQFGLFLAFLTSMIIILLYFSILKKEYSVLFYAVYILCMIIEFLAGKGLGIQFIWSDYSFVTKNIRSLSQTIAVFCMGYFYMKFYTFSKREVLSKNIFKWGTYLTIPLIILYIYKYFAGGMMNLYIYVWVILKIIILIWFINHIYLVRKKRIPSYLIFAFALPIISLILSQGINPKNTDSNWWIYGTANIFYIALVIEILCFTRYIFSSVIKSQKKYTQLKKISDELKYNFQNKTIEIQQNERNKLLSNVHDSFGGYLEALKLRLLQKSENTPEKVQEILDSFYNEYRYLLNSLYSPKINSENFIDNLIEFCDKINKVSNNVIKPHFSFKNTEISQHKCVHLYRILSELITNAIKYSKATEIHVSLYQKNNIILEVIDNGIGFNINNEKLNSYGLKNIKARIEEMKGTLEINSTKNHGSSFVIKIPKNEEN